MDTDSLGCAGCFTKDAEILLLKLEIIRLRAEIEALQKIITNGQATAAGIMNYSQRTMTGGGLPRGTWSMLRGRLESAQEIYRVLR